MRKLLLFLTLTSGLAYAQGARVDNVSFTTTTVGTSTTVIKPLPGSLVTVCDYPATGNTSSIACTNKASVCTSKTLASCSTSVGNPIAADAQGNFGFWVAPGAYDYVICTTSPAACSGPYHAFVPAGIGTTGALSTGAALFNTASSNSAYKFEFGTGSVTNFRIGPANTDGGGYLTSTVSNNLTLTSGSAFNGALWVAKAADIAQVHIGNNQIEFHTDQGLTPGNTFVPTVRMHISGSQVTFRAGSAAVPSISNFEQEPNAVDGFWFPTNQVGVTIGGTGRASFSSTTLAPIAHVGYDLGSASLNFGNVFSRKLIARNVADDANITLAQRDDATNDTYYGNANARDMYLDAGAGRTIYALHPISATGSIITDTQLTSTLATGTRPIVVTSTTPVTNLNASLVTYNKSGTQITNTHAVIDSCTLGTDCAVTLSGSSVFSSSSSYKCFALDTTAAAAIKIVYTSGTQFTLTGTGTDVLHYGCIGN